MAPLRQFESSIPKIAEALGRSKSTIARELRRNEAPPGEVWPNTAHQKARDRRHRGCRLDWIPEIREFVKTQLTGER
jgi:IS30 family transposase